jgi:high affinity Mn2+ porin
VAARKCETYRVRQTCLIRSSTGAATAGLWRPRLLSALAVLVCLATLAAAAWAQDPPADAGTPDAPGPRDTFFEHSNTAKWWVSGQANFVFQAHGDFYAAYSGPNSLKDTSEHATSRVLTLFTGYEFTPNSILYLDVEEAGWGGISGALGLAGFTNLDVVRNPQLGGAPYIARLMFEQVIPFSQEKIEIPRGPLTLATQVPVRRLEIRFGKFSLADFFDNNIGGSDSHYQFLNWTAANNGAWDYAADTRGYTVGAIFDYEDRNWGLRFAEALMPKVANGPNLDADVARARAENIELELRYKLLKNKDTSIRFLNFVNHADMGTYRDAIAIYLADPTQPPDIIATRKQGTIKYGFGINFQQELSSDVWAFGRWGWNEGQHESFAYTEADSTLQLGVYAKGTRWHRSLDRLGATFISNAIGAYHKTYLADGGLGFILGDGGLNYGREEAFYTVHAWRGLYFAVDYQHINNPGYNRDRGPVSVPGLRLHLEF